MLEFILERGNYWAIIGLMMIGLYIAFASTNLIKQLVGLGLFQTSILLLYVSLGRIDGGTAPILRGVDAGEHGGDTEAAIEAASHHTVEGLEYIYSNPLPHVLMLTAIVVGIATLAVGLAIIVRIREAYGTVESDEIRVMDLNVALAEAADEVDEASTMGGVGV